MGSTADLSTYYELADQPVVDAHGHTYHGICRQFYCAADWERSAAAEVFMEWCRAPWPDLGDWDIFFPDLELARDFQRRFREAGFEFGVLAVRPCDSRADAAAAEKLPGHLGLDVTDLEPSSALHPLALWQMFDEHARKDSLTALWELPAVHFRERLNKWGLLDDFDEAALLRRVMRALERIDTTDQSPQGVRVLAVQELAP